MANRYGGITGSKKISEDWNNINLAFDKVQADVDAKAATVNSHIANADIHVTKTDKTIWDGHVANADIHVTAAQKAAWDAKADGSTATDLAAHIADQVVHVTQADHDKLAGIEEGAQVNQNAFAKVNDITAADPSSQFYIVGGTGITVTTNPNSGEVTVTATGDAAPGAHGSTHTEHGADPIPTATLTEGGLLSAAQLADILAHGEMLDEHATAITDLEDRLDEVEVVPLTLQPGVQVVTAAKDARFKLGEIRGKTEINGQGRIGIVGVENPYVIATSGNLLPPFYEWVHSANTEFEGPYQLRLKNTVGDAVVYAVKFSPGETYTYSAEHTGSIAVNAWDANGGLIGGESLVGYTDAQSVTFTVPLETAVLEVYFSNITEAGILPEVSISNPMLTVGTEPKPFEPQRSSLLAWQTELHANPEDGSDPDVLFEQDGEYRKLTKWKKIALDGSQEMYFLSRHSGMKRISIMGLPRPDMAIVLRGTKYDGTTLNATDTAVYTDAIDWSTQYGFLLSISNADSGWGDDYTPTQDEIKAYFNGWRMCDAHTAQLYTGAPGETRCWGPIAHPANQIGSPGWVDPVVINVPTYRAPTLGGYEYHPYNLLYRLAKDTVEPVTTEGCLTLLEGDNVVEVGTGIVLRERAKPRTDGTNYFINIVDAGYEQTRLKNKASKLLSIYRNNGLDSRWIRESSPASYGTEHAVTTTTANFDQSAAYSVTYFKLDKSPTVSISGTLAANEKAQISDLTAGVAEALQRVSVVEQKKAEKDAPGWISPTLLNGWTIAVTGFGVRINNNRLEFRGSIVSNTPVVGVISVLPVEMRVKKSTTVTTASFTDGEVVPVAIDVLSDGSLVLITEPKSVVSFEGISIPLE